MCSDGKFFFCLNDEIVGKHLDDNQITCTTLLVVGLHTNFFSLTRRFWNQMVTWRSERSVVAQILLLLSLVMNLLASYSFSSSFNWILVYGTLFLRPRRYPFISVWCGITSAKNSLRREENLRNNLQMSSTISVNVSWLSSIASKMIGEWNCDHNSDQEFKDLMAWP